MRIPGYSLVELYGRNDPLLPDWLDLYETSFPPCERVLVSFMLRLLERQENSQAADFHLSALIDADGILVGMAVYQIHLDLSAAHLWYIAISPGARSRGLGTEYYQAILAHVFERVDALIFEVEIPKRAESEEERHNGERRIDFYKRKGAGLLTGIHYLQSVGSHMPPTPMHLMAQPRAPMSAEVIYTLVKKMFPKAITQTGPLALT